MLLKNSGSNSSSAALSLGSEAVLTAAARASYAASWAAITDVA